MLQFELSIFIIVWWCWCWVSIQSLSILPNALAVNYIHSVCVFEIGAHKSPYWL